jgi:hypothetical protein
VQEIIPSLLQQTPIDLPPIHIAPFDILPPSICATGSPLPDAICVNIKELSGWLLNRTLTLAGDQLHFLSRSIINGDLTLSEGASFSASETVTVQGDLLQDEESSFSFAQFDFTRQRSPFTDEPRINVSGSSILSGTIFIDLTEAEVLTLKSVPAEQKQAALVESASSSGSPRLVVRQSNTDCNKVSATSHNQIQPNGRTTMNAVFAVSQEGCKRKRSLVWIVPTAVGCALIGAAAITILFLKHKATHKAIAPFSAAKATRANAHMSTLQEIHSISPESSSATVSTHESVNSLAES